MIKNIELTPEENIITSTFNRGDLIIILCDSTNGSFSIECPDASIAQGVIFVFIKKVAGNTVTLTPRTDLSQKINAANSKALTSANEMFTMYSDGTNYYGYSGSETVDLSAYLKLDCSNSPITGNLKTTTNKYIGIGATNARLVFVKNT